MRKTTMLLSTLVVLPLAMPVVADTQWPTQDVTLVTHSSSGGGGDVMLRNMGRTLEQKFGINTVVDNRVGGSGAVAMSWMANQAPNDGYTILSVTPTQLITPLRAPGIPTYQDLTPIARLLTDPTTLYVHENSQFESIEELLQHARENPRSLSIGIGSAGSLDQLVLQNFARETDIDVRTIPHEGGGDAVVALLGEHVDAVIGEPGQALTHLESGTLRMLAVFQEERLETYPEVPTLQELGYEVISNKFRGVFGPPDMDPELVEEIGHTLRDIVNDEPWKTYWGEGSMTPSYLGHEEFTEFLHVANEELREFVEGLQ
ncbi:tripartite tricarboxylate transporter substrate binding protein [Billgrantia aerodenitrificans]|uniref:Tripartite tricarboxylate transporter substrate binding protein n=1 Tax=Billgrantia aerodenitrificans TaxID=2733483 RepID=A0ABS9ARK2_9GAMM|nr:tripartite tricarboxylate transporter substrate binding protein [Halomonas aerodenitrificans]MCE8024359.1 tripartite tricarboxylate transporter substrate binding protein [Halomonas aerodenitrificans]